MFYSDFDRFIDKLMVADRTPLWETYSKTYVPSKFAVEVKDDKAFIALSVLGHDPKNIEINCYEDKIEVKAKKGEEKTPFTELVANIDERITLGKDLDGRSAKAEIKNGILTFIVERKEESKPKKLTIKVG
ncbi:Hsp20/alpha crystallin family protein [archaeon]|jgi:HSP20 family molecular chaperone IbpA|nr:Hsp20/alpha crystallin family protein [archaeon]NDB55114.1 Hsp20/alpha crystallin family protein [archaeon]